MNSDFRCLSLWENDRSLIEALEVAKDILVPIELLNTLWPCPGKLFSHSVLAEISVFISLFSFAKQMRRITEEGHRNLPCHQHSTS